MQTVTRVVQTLAPSEPGERLGMLVPGPNETPDMVKAQQLMREAYRLLNPCVERLGTDVVTDSPAQTSLRAAFTALKFAGGSLADSLSGARRFDGGAE
tara:strand:+ start:13167 stop:13460 length:294 start_codon:yes stop_codon:yes gene_type:complete